MTRTDPINADSVPPLEIAQSLEKEAYESPSAPGSHGKRYRFDIVSFPPDIKKEPTSELADSS